MESTSQVTKYSAQQTFDDPLKEAVSRIVMVMSSDYGASFKRTFTNDEEVLNLKRRLYSKLRGLPIDCIVDGYEDCVAASPKFCPTVPEIIGAVLEVIKRRKKHAENKAEAERVSALPAPTISCNPIEMLASAKKSSGIDQKETSEERMKRRAEIEKNHNALLTLNSSKIKKIYAKIEQSCQHNGCRNAGGISNSTNGKGNFYCADHYRMA